MNTVLPPLRCSDAGVTTRSFRGRSSRWRRSSRCLYWLQIALSVSLFGAAGVHATSPEPPVLGSTIQTIRVGTQPIAVATTAQRVFVITWGSASADGRTHGPVRVVVLHAMTGAIVRTVTLGMTTSADYPPAPPVEAADPRTKHVFVVLGGAAANGPHSQGRVSMLDAATGALLRTVAVGLNPRAVAIDAQTGRAFVVNSGDERDGGAGSVSVLDTRTGAVLHTTAVGLYPSVIAVDAPARRVFVGSQNDGSITMLDAATGAVARPPRYLATPGYGNGEVIADHGSICAMAADPRAHRVLVSLSTNRASSHLTTLDATTGLPVYTLTGLTAVVGCPAQTIGIDAVRGRALALTGPPKDCESQCLSTITVLATHSGRAIRSVPFAGSFTKIVVDDRTGRAFTTKTVFSTTSGTVLGTLPTGSNTTDLALDPSTGHLWVTAGDGTVTLLAVRPSLASPLSRPPTVPVGPACCGAQFIAQTQHPLDAVQ